MSKDAQNIIEKLRSGEMNLSELKGLAPEGSQPVDVTGWEVCYSSSTGQLSGYCTATATNSGDTITGLGFIIYESDGSPMICLQYSNGFNDAEIMTSVGTNLYTTSMGNSVLSIVYGFTQNSGFFYFSDILSVGSC